MAGAVRNAVQMLGLDAAGGRAHGERAPRGVPRARQDVGRIAPGLRANLVLADDQLAVRETWIDGVGPGRLSG